MKDYLTASSVAPDIVAIKAVGMGDENPVATNNTVAGREQNRRVDIVILPVG